MVGFKFTAQLFLAGLCPGGDSYPKPLESKATLHCARGIIPKPFRKRQAITWVNVQYSRLGVVCVLPYANSFQSSRGDHNTNPYA
jgi:hypothetical protein